MSVPHRSVIKCWTSRPVLAWFLSLGSHSQAVLLWAAQLRGALPGKGVWERHPNPVSRLLV